MRSSCEVGAWRQPGAGYEDAARAVSECVRLAGVGLRDRDARGESGPESGESPANCHLSPLCLGQSRVSPVGPVG